MRRSQAAGTFERKTDTEHHGTGRTASKDLSGVGLPRRADPKGVTSYTPQTPTSTRTGLSRGSEDNRDLPNATTTRTITYKSPSTAPPADTTTNTAWTAFRDC